MKRIAVGLLLLTGAASAAAPASALPYFDRTVFVRSELRTNTPYDEAKKNSGDAGSGFFVRCKDQLVFITAKHVARKTNPETQLCFRTVESKSHFARLFALTAPDEKNPWRIHPTADLAAFRVVFNPKFDEPFLNEIRALALPFDMLSTNEVERSRRVAVCGFPIGLGTRDSISPLVTTAFVASRQLDFEVEGKHTLMYLVGPGIGAGCSGGPVSLATESGRVEDLVGAYVATYFDATGGKLSGIVPAQYIAELVTLTLANPKEKP